MRMCSGGSRLDASTYGHSLYDDGQWVVALVTEHRVDGARPLALQPDARPRLILYMLQVGVLKQTQQL